MKNRLGVIGTGLIIAGFGFAIAGGVAYAKVQDGYDSLQAFSAAQNVTLTYDDNGDLTDRGTVEEAQAIMALLKTTGNTRWSKATSIQTIRSSIRPASTCTRWPRSPTTR